MHYKLMTCRVTQHGGQTVLNNQPHKRKTLEKRLELNEKLRSV